jgi:hypothetical protein
LESRVDLNGDILRLDVFNMRSRVVAVRFGQLRVVELLIKNMAMKPLMNICTSFTPAQPH